MSKGHPVLLIIDIDEADYAKLGGLGFGHRRDGSWSPGNRRDPGFRELLRECGRDRPGPLTVGQRSLSVSADCRSLEEYFAHFAIELRTAVARAVSSSNGVLAVVLNLMPFCLCTTLADKTLRGLFGTDQQPLTGPSGCFLLAVRNVDWIVRSSVLAELRQNDSVPRDLLAVDIRGYGASFRGSVEHASFEVKRDPFRQILDLDPDAIYRSLVFGTNAYIGHYELRHSHIRTHYDLKEFIKRDNVWEYLYGLLLNVVGGAESLLFLGTGLEDAVLLRIRDQLKSMMGERYRIDFDYLPTAASARRISPNWTAEYDMAIVMTDIVNSGKTLGPILRSLDAVNHGRKPVRAFAVTKMSNSPSFVDGVEILAGTQIRREYYPRNRKTCPLCLLGQPLTPVANAEDFCQVEAGQLTPYDFWEIVTDSKALVRRKVDAQGRFFSYRIDTVRVVRRYANWLRNVIARRIGETWPNCHPDAICTVANEPGSEFAELVSQAAHIERVVRIPRDALRRVTPSAGPPDSVTKEVLDALRGCNQVLVVDDGANFGDTLMLLISFCRSVTGTSPVGALVLDSRLDLEGVARIRMQMARRPLVALYEWPALSTQL
jgi:hypothetical protein